MITTAQGDVLYVEPLGWRRWCGAVGFNATLLSLIEIVVSEFR
jgi:hypothetical protein